MTRTKAVLTAARTALRGVAAWVGARVDVRDWHFYGGLAIAYLGARALEPELALMFVGLVLMAVGLLYRGKA